MKKIRKSVWMLLFVLMIFSMTACGRNNTNQSGQGSSGAGQSSGVTSGAETAGTGNGMAGTGAATGTSGGTTGNTTGAGNNTGTGNQTGEGNTAGNGNTARPEESSTGVINGLIDDVERGVNDVTGTETTGSVR